MSDFLELIETIRSQDADTQRLFGDAGTGVRHASRAAGYNQRLVEAARLIGDVFTGKKHPHVLREAMTTSDFPYLFGDVLDRQVLANYREWPSIWRMYAKAALVTDFRTVNRFAISGGEAVLEEVEQQGTYPMAGLSEAKYSYAVKKYGRRIPFSWEAMVNDDLSALQDVPQRFGRAARRSEDKFATQLHVDASGPHASVYTSGNANIITSNPALSTAGLQTAFTVLGAMLDGESEPILIEAVVLEVPPALEVTALNIMNAISITLNPNSSAGTADQIVDAINWMKNRTTLVVNPYIPIVASTANGSTSWFLHASPSNGRPFAEVGMLRGHAEPEIFIKEPNARRVGGGIVNPMDGDFETDSVEYKLRHVFGGSILDPKMSVGSNGSGS
jgi:voltage-gated potassium channel Kch